MAYRDLRAYLKVLEDAGKLHHVRAEVDETWSAKMGIEVTKKHRYPGASVPLTEDLARARGRWAEYGFAEILESARRSGIPGQV
ncbi:MAG TPA: hypothetical protein VJT32_13835 [bacterium]|nr:hypothetical protein [bacterium]